MIRTCPDDNKELFSLRVDDDSFSKNKSQKFPLAQSKGNHFRVVGSLNGVIWLTDDQYLYRYPTYLWNPSIRKCVVLPYPNINFVTFGGYEQATGFGYDAKTNDYKVLRINESYGCRNKPLEVELYSLSTGVWRNISHLTPNIRYTVRPLCERTRQAFVNGASHFVMKNSPSRFMILAFHFGDEVFRCIDLPIQAATTTHYLHTWPTVVKGSLSLFHRAKGMCCLWVMKEYGDSSSWTKQWNITIDPQIGRIFGLKNEGEFLVEIEGNLYSFDAIRGSELLGESNQWLKKLRLHSRVRSWQYSFHSERYTESLALLGAPISVGHEQLESLSEELASRYRELLKESQMKVAEKNAG